MSSETPFRLPLNERIQRCPIHKAINVELTMRGSKFPKKYWPYMHEVLVIRGEYPKYLSNAHGLECLRRVDALDKQYGYTEDDLKIIDRVYNAISDAWFARSSELN